jgi:hypothetical protein
LYGIIRRLETQHPGSSCQKKLPFDDNHPLPYFFIDEKTQSISLFQNFSRDHSLGRDDVRSISASNS